MINDGQYYVCTLDKHTGNKHEHKSVGAEIRWTAYPDGGSYGEYMSIRSVR